MYFVFVSFVVDILDFKNAFDSIKFPNRRFWNFFFFPQSLKSWISPQFMKQSSYLFLWIFLWYLSTSFVNLNPTTRRIWMTSTRWSSTKKVELYKFSKKTKLTEGSIYSGPFLEKKCKKSYHNTGKNYLIW